MIFRNGRMYATIMIYGQNQMKTVSVILDRVLRKLVEAEREKNGREKQTTMIIVDSKSIQNADTAEEKGYDAGKKHLE